MFIRGVPQPLEAPPPAAPAPTRQAGARQVAAPGLLVRATATTASTDHRQKLPGKAFAGGQKFPLPDGKGVAIAPNITSDKATGIGAYSDDDLRRVFDEGKGKTGRFLYVDAVVATTAA